MAPSPRKLLDNIRTKVSHATHDLRHLGESLRQGRKYAESKLDIPRELWDAVKKGDMNSQTKVTNALEGMSGAQLENLKAKLSQEIKNLGNLSMKQSSFERKPTLEKLHSLNELKAQVEQKIEHRNDYSSERSSGLQR